MAGRFPQRAHRPPQRLCISITDDDLETAAEAEPVRAHSAPRRHASQPQMDVGFQGSEDQSGQQTQPLLNSAGPTKLQCAECLEWFAPTGMGNHRARHLRKRLADAKAAAVAESVRAERADATAAATTAATASAAAAAAATAATTTAAIAAAAAAAAAQAASPLAAFPPPSQGDARVAAPASHLTSSRSAPASNSSLTSARIPGLTLNPQAQASSAATFRQASAASQQAPDYVEFTFYGMTPKNTWTPGCAGYSAAVPTHGEGTPTVSETLNTAAGLAHLSQHDCTKLFYTTLGHKEGSRFSVLQCDGDLGRLIEHAELQSKRFKFPQLPSLYAMVKQAQQAGVQSLGSGGGRGNSMGRGAGHKPAATHRVEHGSHTQDYGNDAKSAILLAYPEIEERLREPVVAQAVNQWAAALTAKHNLAVAADEKEFGQALNTSFNIELVEAKYPEYFVKKLQMADNIAATSKSCVDKLEARMGSKKPKSDFACTPASARAAQAAALPSSRLGRSASESELYSPRQAHQQQIPRATATPDWTHIMRWSEMTHIEVNGTTVPVQLRINQLLHLSNASLDGSQFYMKFEYDGGYASSYIPRGSLQKLGSPEPMQQPQRSRVRF